MCSLALACVALAGCGEVVDQRPPGFGLDTRLCPGNMVEACGASCVRCDEATGRTVPTCDGIACGSACRNTALRCSDSSCVQTEWTFEAGSLDGITARSPMGLALAVRNLNGAQALAIDVTNLSEISFRIPVCLSGVVDVRQKTFSLQTFFQGGSSGGVQYYLQGSLPSPQSGGFLGQIGVASNMWTPYTAQLSDSQFAGTCSEITIQAGTLGAQFSGTIWFDDLKIE